MPKRNMRIGGYAGAGRWCAVLSLGASKRGVLIGNHIGFSLWLIH